MVKGSKNIRYVQSKRKSESFSIRQSPFTDSVQNYLKDLDTELCSLNHSRNSKNAKFIKMNKEFKETNELVSLVRSAYKILESLHPSEQIDRNNRKSILFIFKKMIINQEYYAISEDELVVIKSILILYKVDIKESYQPRSEVIF